MTNLVLKLELLKLQHEPRIEIKNVQIERGELENHQNHFSINFEWF